MEFGRLLAFSSCPDSTICANFFENRGHHYERKHNVAQEFDLKNRLFSCIQHVEKDARCLTRFSGFREVLIECSRFIDRFDTRVIKPNPLAKYPD
jgi:hypothetical protein